LLLVKNRYERRKANVFVRTMRTRPYVRENERDAEGLKLMQGTRIHASFTHVLYTYIFGR